MQQTSFYYKITHKTQEFNIGGADFTLKMLELYLSININVIECWECYYMGVEQLVSGYGKIKSTIHVTSWPNGVLQSITGAAVPPLGPMLSILLQMTGVPSHQIRELNRIYSKILDAWGAKINSTFTFTSYIPTD